MAAPPSDPCGGGIRERLGLGLFVLGLIGLVLALAGCHTYEAVTDAPIEVWVHLELIMLAVWCDLVSILDLLL